ncbi:MAG: ZmpA/ZmpB/ZmpC family metallo-endopeptidase-related protein [Enterococcus sp.]
MKKYLLAGCILLLFGTSAYAASTESVSTAIQSIFSKKEVRADSNDSLSTENLTLNEITTHKNGNDFTTLIEANYIDEQQVQNHQETIDVLAERLTDTDFHVVLSSFGNEQLGIIPEYDEHTGESFDRIRLSETYERLQKEGKSFFGAFFTAFPNATQEQIEEHFNELIFTATYLGNWYDVRIGEHSLWTAMYFYGGELTTEKQWSMEHLYTFAEELKANNYEALLSKNVRDTFNKTKVYSSFTGKVYSDLIEWFVEKETGSTDYSAWFYDYFNGIVKIDNVLTETDDVGIWNRSKSLKDNLPYLLTQKPGSNLTLIESYRLLMFVSGTDKENDILNAIRVIKNQEALFYRTYEDKEEVDNAIGQIILWAPNENLLDENNDYSRNLLLPSENFTSHGGSGAVGSYQFIGLQRNGYHPGTIAHELGHCMDRLLNAGSEFLTTYIDNVFSNPGVYVNMYADGEAVKFSKKFPINANVADIKDKNDLVTRTKNSEDLLYALDAVVADVVLEMPLSQQINYIKKVPIDVDSGLRTDTENQYTDADVEGASLTVAELEAMNLRSIDDLIAHGLVIMEPKDTQKDLLGNGGQGYGSPLTYASYFLANGKYLNHSHRIINTIIAEEGWEGFETFNNAHTGNWKEDGSVPSIYALRTALNDPTVTYRSLTQEKYHENREKLGKYGLKNLTYAELKKEFESNIDDFYASKQKLYNNHLALTNSFTEEAFGFNTSSRVNVGSYNELYDAVTANPKAEISILQDFTVPSDAKTMDTFEGVLRGNGHTISNGKIKLFSGLNNATIDSLVLKDFMIEDQETHTGILAGQAENSSIQDVHGVNSTVSIKQGVQMVAGGIVGESINNSITRSSSQENTISGRFAGGIVGYGEKTNINNSYVKGGLVSGNGSSGLRIGGFAGGFVTGNLNNLYTSATVKNGRGFIGSTYYPYTISITEANALAIGNVDEGQLKFMTEDKNSKTYQNNYELDSATGLSSTSMEQLDVNEVTEETLKEKAFYNEQLGLDTTAIWNAEKVQQGELPYLRNSDPRNVEGVQDPLLFEWVQSIDDQATNIEGKVSEQSIITVYDEEQEIAKKETETDGHFSIPIEQLIGKHHVKLVAETEERQKEFYMEVKGSSPQLTIKEDLTIPVGEYGFKPETFIESVTDRYGEENLSYDIDTSNLNFGLPGKYEVMVTATNPIGMSSTVNVPVTINDYNSIVLRAYFTQERLRLALQTSDHSIRLVANSAIESALDSGAGKYLDISLYDQAGKVKKQLSLNAEDKPNQLLAPFDKTPYEQGDFLKISYTQQSNKFQFYQKGEIELPFAASGKEQLFIIQNDELVRITDDLVTTKDLAVEVGSPIESEDFVTTINEGLKNVDVSYTLKNTFNPGKTGEQKNTLSVSAGELFTKELPVKLTYEYDNNLSIRAYSQQERFILGLDESSQAIRFVTDTSLDTVLDSGTGEYLTITVIDKEGQQKYQMKANAEDRPSQLIASLAGKTYADGDRITVVHRSRQKIGLYVDGQLELDYANSQTTEEFVIKNNQLIIRNESQEPLVFEKLDPIDDRSTSIEGKMNTQSMITVYDEEKQIAKAETETDGQFAIPIEPLEGKHQVKLVAQAGDQQEETTFEVKGTAPDLTIKQDLSIHVGEYDLKPETFIESVTDRYGEENLTYDIDATKLNLGLPGKYEVSVTATNPIGMTSSVNVPITIKDYNSIVFRGEGTEERLRVGLQTSNQVIRLVANTDITTVMASGSGKYLEISLYDQNGNLKKQTSINAEDQPEQLVRQFDATPYEQGDSLKVSYVQQENKLQFYQGGKVILPFDSSGKEQLFAIQQDEIDQDSDDGTQDIYKRPIVDIPVKGTLGNNIDPEIPGPTFPVNPDYMISVSVPNSVSFAAVNDENIISGTHTIKNNSSLPVRVEVTGYQGKAPEDFETIEELYIDGPGLMTDGGNEAHIPVTDENGLETSVTGGLMELSAGSTTPTDPEANTTLENNGWIASSSFEFSGKVDSTVLVAPATVKHELTLKFTPLAPNGSDMPVDGDGNVIIPQP